MRDANDIIVRKLRPGDYDAAIDVLTDAFIDFPPVRVVVGSGRGARDRLRRMNAATISGPTKSELLAAERGGDLLGVLVYADQPDCFSMNWRQSLQIMRVIGPRLVPAMRFIRGTMKLHPKTPHRHLLQVAVDPRAQ